MIALKLATPKSIRVEINHLGNSQGRQKNEQIERRYHTLHFEQYRYVLDRNTFGLRSSIELRLQNYYNQVLTSKADFYISLGT